MKDKMKTKHLDSLRAAIEEMFDRMFIAWDQIGDDSELFLSIGNAAINAQGVWNESQPYIDDYDKPRLMTNCVLMAEWLEQLHELTEMYAEERRAGTREQGYMIGWHQLHSMLSFLADELDVSMEGPKCWPIGSDC